MSGDDITPAALNEWLLKLSREVGNALSECGEAAEEAADADREYKRRWSAAFIASDGAVRTREVHADEKTIEERHAAKLAEGRSRSADLAVRARMAQLNALQSVAASVRQEHRWGQTGPEVD